MAVALSPEVQEFFSPTTAGFDHFFLAGPVRGDDTVAFHLALVRHYFLLQPKLLA